MKRKRHSPDQIIQKVTEIKADMSNGISPAEVATRIGVSEQTVIRWINDYGAKENATLRLKTLESENRRLRRALAEVELDKHVLAEAVRGNY
jgi:transposase